MTEILNWSSEVCVSVLVHPEQYFIDTIFQPMGFLNNY